MAFPATLTPTLAATRTIHFTCGDDVDSPIFRIAISRIMGTRSLVRTYGWTISSSTKYQVVTISVKDYQQTHANMQHTNDYVTNAVKPHIENKPKYPVATPTLIKRNEP